MISTLIDIWGDAWAVWKSFWSSLVGDLQLQSDLNFLFGIVLTIVFFLCIGAIVSSLVSLVGSGHESSPGHKDTKFDALLRGAIAGFLQWMIWTFSHRFAIPLLFLSTT
jgi:hypothetical protein